MAKKSSLFWISKETAPVCERVKLILVLIVVFVVILILIFVIILVLILVFVVILVFHIPSLLYLYFGFRTWKYAWKIVSILLKSN